MPQTHHEQAAAGAQFLHQRNPNFHASPEVEHTVAYLNAHNERTPNQPDAKIAAHIGFLANEQYANDGILTGDEMSIAYQVEQAAVALTPENAHAYAKFEANVLRELGRGGEFDLATVPDDKKLEALAGVRKDQIAQLKEWAEELNSDEVNYQDWFKHWVFENVKRHTVFNPDLGKDGLPKGFERRSSSSFALFPELDRESLSLVYDALTEKLGGEPMGFEYNNMRRLLGKANFAELYEEAQNHGFRITDELKAIKTGSWQDFAQSEDPEDAQALSNLISTYRTGWCTAGSETARTQLSVGDFYIWCSTDLKGNDTVPRIAVRMENGTVAEVRGIVGGRRQELEPGLEQVVMDKIKGLPGGEQYFQKAQDMKRLTILEKQLKADPDLELNPADMKFLYELDRSIQGFGYGKDPRIQEARDRRGRRDHAELKVLAVERIRESFDASARAYQAVAGQLEPRKFGFRKKPMLHEGELRQLFDKQLQDWQDRGVLDYAAERIVTHGELHTPVITPNVLADAAQLKQLAAGFGKDQPHATYIYDELYDQYSAEELSGPLDRFQAVRFSLIPSKNDPNLTATAEKQMAMLAERQAKNPALNLRVPSVLDALTYWHTLRAKGDKLNHSSAFEKTIIRHFNLAPKKLGGFLVVPRSCVRGDGKPNLGRSNAGLDSGARFSVG